MREGPLPRLGARSMRVVALWTAVSGVLAVCWPRPLAAEPTAAPRADIPVAACDIPGEPVQWIADYCMALIGTDDEIAASDCINEQLARAPKDACAAKAHFKKRLCGLVVARGARQGTVEECAADPAFSGGTVTRGGVGGT